MSQVTQLCGGRGRGTGSEDGHQAVLWQVHRLSHLSVRVPPRLLPHGFHARTPTGPSPPNGRGTDCSSFYRSRRLMWNLFPFSPQASRIRCGLGCAEVLTTRVSSRTRNARPPEMPLGQLPRAVRRSHVEPGLRVRLVRPGLGRVRPTSALSQLLCQAPWSCEWETLVCAFA